MVGGVASSSVTRLQRNATSSGPSSTPIAAASMGARPVWKRAGSYPRIAMLPTSLPGGRPSGITAAGHCAREHGAGLVERAGNAHRAPVLVRAQRRVDDRLWLLPQEARHRAGVEAGALLELGAGEPGAQDHHVDAGSPELLVQGLT